MPSVESETLLQHLLAAARRHPAKIALRYGDEALTYGEFEAQIFETAARLRASGFAKGSRVPIGGANALAFPVRYFAIHAMGAVAVPADVGQAASVADVGQAVSSCQRGGGQAETACPTKIACPPSSIADLLYTTGTTGRRKGVVLTHANILAAARNITEFIGTGPGDVEVVPLPLSHSFGLGRLRCLALTGHTLVLEPGVGNGARVVKRILDLRATGLAMVPAGFEILRRITGDALGQARDHLRYIEIGSAPIRPETRQWLADLLPHTRICHHYGLTEASRAAFTEYHTDAHKPGTAGRAAPHVEIVICDDAGRRLPPGETGEVVVRGDMVMREYWNQPELTREAFCAEGLKTGDLGYLDADGYLFLIGRRGDRINVGGLKVAPDEVESLLCQMDGVRDAGCAAAPDELTGECVKAYVVADREIGVREVVTFLRSRLEEFKIPRIVERIEAIPRTSSGKIQRQLLRGAKEAAWTREP